MRGAHPDAEPDLARFIDARMPLGEPDRCNGDCPIDIAAYIHRTFRGEIVCDGPVLAHRGLRLLTTREYRATIDEPTIRCFQPTTAPLSSSPALMRSK